MSTFPKAFAALPFKVLADERVSAAQDEARALGFSAGYAAGARVAAQELDQQRADLMHEHLQRQAQDREYLNQAIASFAQAAEAARSRELPMLDEARSTLCTLALELARAVVGTTDRQDSSVAGVSSGALGALLRAVAASGQTAALSIAMAPEQAQQINQHWDQVVTVLGDAVVSVVPDASIHAGGAVATYPNGHVDATLETAFSRAKLALENALQLAHLQPAVAP
ncbi:FliH/SctL family protein [Jonesiaceae bacterium BS-20]|uniref:FliH/SctL family protein n=1 Tax=Jonesiaceae bacterium BS-20 TaxID=3120821 RepID=A0AAU7DXB4_9MICO